MVYDWNAMYHKPRTCVLTNQSKVLFYQYDCGNIPEWIRNVYGRFVNTTETMRNQLRKHSVNDAEKHFACGNFGCFVNKVPGISSVTWVFCWNEKFHIFKMSAKIFVLFIGLCFSYSKYIKMTITSDDSFKQNVEAEPNIALNKSIVNVT